MPYPPGHFYSPVVDPSDLRRRSERLWPVLPPEVPGIDFRSSEQRRLLRELVPILAEFDPPASEADAAGEVPRFYEENPMFSGLDARLLYGLLRKLRPRRLFEVGCGFSTLLAAEVNRRHLESSCRIICIEPFPRDFLVGGLAGLDDLIVQQVEEIPVSFFQQLEAGDMLFIDSSHVSKTGSDVNYLYLEVLPRLAPGVLIHAHDIFLPCEYPRDWVLEEERSWNEQYLLRALLTFSAGFEVVFGSAYAYTMFPSLIRELLGRLVGGGSFWFRRADRQGDLPVEAPRAAEMATFLAPPAGPMTDIRRLESFADWCELLDDPAGVWRERLRQEAALAAGRREFTLSGRCFPCGQQVAFRVDLQFSGENAEGRRLPNWRERLVCPECEMNNRMRAAIHHLVERLRPREDAPILLTERGTAFARWLGARYPRAAAQEELPEEGEAGSFEWIVSLERFQAVADLASAFRRCRELLADEGVLFFTVPFHLESEKNRPGQLGWETLDLLRDAGFGEVYALAYWSLAWGYLGGVQTVFVARVERSGV